MRAEAAGWGFKGADHRNGLAPLANIKTAQRAVSDICVNNKCTQAQIGRSGKCILPAKQHFIFLYPYQTAVAATGHTADTQNRA